MTLAEPLSAIFADAKPDIWEKTLVMYQGIVERTMTQLNIKCDSFQTTAEERGDLVRKVKDVCWSALKAKVTEERQDSSLLLKLRTRFEARFRYDERDVPRVWTPADDIDSYFTTARDEVPDSILKSRLFANLLLSSCTRPRNFSRCLQGLIFPSRISNRLFR